MLKRALLRIWKWLPVSPGCRWRLAWLIRPKFRVSVVAVILDGRGRLLLCDHTYRGYYPWGLPGGDLKKGEKVHQAVAREVHEETGLKIDALDLLLVKNDPDFPHVTMVFQAGVHSGEFQPNLEVSGVQFFEPEALPERIFPPERELLEQALAVIAGPGTARLQNVHRGEA